MYHSIILRILHHAPNTDHLETEVPIHRAYKPAVPEGPRALFLQAITIPVMPEELVKIVHSGYSDLMEIGTDGPFPPAQPAYTRLGA